MTKTGTLIPIFAAVALLGASAPASAQTDAPFDALASLAGKWQVKKDDGTVVQDCDKAQHFEVSEDRSHVRMTEPWAKPPFQADYRIIVAEEERVLAFIQGEGRKTEGGDPVLWWFQFTDKDHFRFRRYDWPSENATSVQWERCS